MAGENVGSIEYTIDANTDPLLKANKSAQTSLGTMERSFDNAGDSADKFDTKLSAVATGVKKATSLLKTATTVGLAAAAAFTAIALKAASAAREIENMARLSGTTTTEFQELAFGANKAGISAEKLGDIFKDVQDKIGDFINTGGGELADYFESIAPLVGQTAEEFANLSGPDALIKFQAGLEAANLSASEQVFYLESLANDAALLTPLLADNAAGFKKAAQEANALNVVLSEADIAELSAVKNEFNALFSVVGSVTSQIVADLAPSIISALQTVSRVVASVGGAIENFFDIFQSPENIDKVDTLKSKLEELEKERDKLESGGTLTAVGRSANADKIRFEELNKEIAEYKSRIEELEGTTITIEVTAGRKQAGTASGSSIFDSPGFREGQTFEIEDSFQLSSSGNTKGDNSTSQMALNMQEALGVSQQMASELEMLDMKFQDIGTTINDTLVGAALTFGDTIGDAVANGIAEGESLNEVLSNIGTTIATQVLSSLISLGVQYGINAALQGTADATMAASATAAMAATTAAGVASASTLASAWAPAAAAASIATSGGAAVAGGTALATTYGLSNTLSLAGGRMNGGGVAAGNAYEVTENGKPEMLTVGGKNILMMGNQSGTVTSNADLTSGGTGGVIVNVNNNASGAAASATSSTSDGKTIIDVVVADIRKNGQITRAITSNTTANYKP